MTSSPTDRPTLLVDVMCGKLATYLRMCGYDTAYALDRGIEADEAILELARREDRLLLTRDVELARRAGDRGRRVEAREPTEQLAELAAMGFDLNLRVVRCASCNGELIEIDAAQSTPIDVPDPVDTPVWRCPACGQHFWRGSHWTDLERTLSEID